MGRYHMVCIRTNRYDRSLIDEMSTKIIGKHGSVWLTGRSSFDIDRGGVITFPYPDIVDVESVITTTTAEDGIMGFGIDTKNLYVANGGHWYKFDSKWHTWETHELNWEEESFITVESASTPI